MKPDVSLKDLVAYAFDQLEQVPRDNPRLLLLLSVTIGQYSGLSPSISAQMWGEQRNESVYYAPALNTYAKIDAAVREVIRALAEYSPEAELARAEEALKAAEQALAEARKAAAL